MNDASVYAALGAAASAATQLESESPDPKKLLESAIIGLLDTPKTHRDKEFQSKVIRHLKGILKAREDWISQHDSSNR